MYGPGLSTKVEVNLNIHPTRETAMMTLYNGPWALDVAHATREIDLRDAADARRRALVRRTATGTPVRRRHRPWWWGLARADAS